MLPGRARGPPRGPRRGPPARRLCRQSPRLRGTARLTGRGRTGNLLTSGDLTVPVESPKEFGEELRRERELREVSREQLVTATRVSMRQVEALESGRFELLPAKVFSRGFVRAISLHLGMDAERTAAAFSHVYDAWSAEQEAKAEREWTASGQFRALSRPRRTVSVKTSAVGLSAAAVIALLTGAAAFWKSRASEQAPAAPARAVADAATPGTGAASLSLPPEIAAETIALAPAEATLAQEPSLLPASAQTTSAAAGRTLTLTFHDDCWTEVTMDGKVAAAELCRKGTVREFSGAQRFTLTLGNAGGVGVALDGRELPPVGGAGQVVRNVVIDETTPRASADG
ncbi:MAG: helix-turn-helix domain-containing protein [Acidobacteria bacterium]|nr:MAG: helix-turn-helix domain-containing protein [Acidobacteriota bacterium]